MGHLAAWLIGGGVSLSAAEHLAYMPTLAERRQARAKLQSDDAMTSLLSLEGELGVDEPLEIR